MERKRQKRQQHVHPVIQSHAALVEIMLGPQEIFMNVSAVPQSLHQKTWPSQVTTTAALLYLVLRPSNPCTPKKRSQPNRCWHQLFTSHIRRHAATEGIKGSTISACIPTTPSLPPAPTTLTHPTRHGTTTTKLLITRSTHTSQPR